MLTTTDLWAIYLCRPVTPEHRNESFRTRVRSIPTLWLQGDSLFLKIGRMINVNTQPTKSTASPRPILFVCHYPHCCRCKARRRAVYMKWDISTLYLTHVIIILRFLNDDFTCARYLRYRQMTVPLSVSVSNESERSDVISGGIDVKVHSTAGPDGGINM